MFVFSLTMSQVDSRLHDNPFGECVLLNMLYMGVSVYSLPDCKEIERGLLVIFIYVIIENVVSKNGKISDGERKKIL